MISGFRSEFKPTNLSLRFAVFSGPIWTRLRVMFAAPAFFVASAAAATAKAASIGLEFIYVLLVFTGLTRFVDFRVTKTTLLWEYAGLPETPRCQEHAKLNVNTHVHRSINTTHELDINIST